MNIVLTDFALARHFDPERAGTTITDRTPEEFEQEANGFLMRHEFGRHLHWADGYAPFCKLLFVTNWTNALTGTMPITSDNGQWLKSEYAARNDKELPVLVRWFEGLSEVPEAECLVLVLYNEEQLLKEDVDIGDADDGIVAILGQLQYVEEPMISISAMRNALGILEGGSGVPLDRDAYIRSVEFWNRHAMVKISP